MMKVETAVRVSEQFPAGKSSDYIWLLGQPWPVPMAEDSAILRIEVFGPEKEAVESINSLGEQGAGGQVRFWYRSDASYLSHQMRQKYGQREEA